MWSFEYQPCPQLARDFEITYTVPSACAAALSVGAADIGIIPAITYASIPNLVVLGDVAIAARGPVRSILLISKVPLDQVRTIAADTSSRTSVVLAQVLLTKWFGRPPEMIPMAPNLEPMLAACDAALIIGDPALQVTILGLQSVAANISQPLYVHDLSELWREKTGKPFVFAFWAMRRAAFSEAQPKSNVADVFNHSRDEGTRPENVDRIADVWSSRLGISHHDVTSYLNDNIVYKLEPDCLEGLRLFYRYAAEIGAIGAVPSLEFVP